MSHIQKMRAYLDAHHIEMDVADFVTATSNIYHSFEALNYDARHDSIEKSKVHWSTVTEYLNLKFDKNKKLRVLDFGCGTGFATGQILHSSLNSNIEQITCYDLSPEMIDQCKSKFVKEPRIVYYADQIGLEQMLKKLEKFDLVVCNSLVHHLLQPESLFDIINKTLQPGGFFVMGHEPNKSFYTNKHLQNATKLFRIYKRIRQRFVQSEKPNPAANIAVQTQKEMVKKGIVAITFPADIIPKFVDIHVPMSNYVIQPWGELGFDLAFVNQFLDNNFTLSKQLTYNHIKDEKVYSSMFWRKIAAKLATTFPEDGADAIFIFKKSS